MRSYEYQNYIWGMLVIGMIFCFTVFTAYVFNLVFKYLVHANLIFSFFPRLVNVKIFE